MKNQKGVALIYIIVVALMLVIIGSIAYLGASNEHAMKIAELKKKEEANKNIEQNIEIEQEIANNDDIVPVYTPEQFSLVGSGQQVFVRETGRTYTFSIDKTYMFYGVAEELTTAVKEQLSEKLKNEIIVEMNEKGVMVSTVKAQKPEAPRLATNMVAVYWSKDGGATASIHEEGATPIYSKIDANGKPSSAGTVNPNFKEENWYEYVQQANFVDEKISRWANGVTDDGSWWVWIPRYKYKITDKPGVTDTASAGIVDVKFISVDETSGTEGYVTRKNADGEFITQDDEGYIIHPAFEDGSSNGAKAKGHSDYVEYNNGEWDSELAGFWVAKYEMSMEDGSGNAVNPTSAATGNVEISTSVKMVSKTNRTTWTGSTSGMAYKNCYNYNRNNESHLIKMSEWGAVVFFAHSQYGRNANEVSVNSTNWVTGYTGESGTTTGNVYGVYDLNGGAATAVSAWNTVSAGASVTSCGNITVDGYGFGITGGTSTKYATSYKNTTGTYIGDVIKTMGKIGDATKEVFVTSDRYWYSDFVEFPDAVNDYPFMARGGFYYYVDNCGIFSSFRSSGQGAATTGSAYPLGFRCTMSIFERKLKNKEIAIDKL